MRHTFKILILLPFVLANVGCSKGDKLTFKSAGFTFETYYNDEYFLLDNKNVHEEIALASHAMALATFSNETDYKDRGNNLKDLWHTPFLSLTHHH